MGVLIRRKADTQRDTRSMCAQRKDHKRTHQQGRQLQVKERGSRGTDPACTVVLDFQCPDREKINGYCYAAQAD